MSASNQEITQMNLYEKLERIRKLVENWLKKCLIIKNNDSNDRKKWEIPTQNLPSCRHLT